MTENFVSVLKTMLFCYFARNNGHAEAKPVQGVGMSEAHGLLVSYLFFASDALCSISIEKNYFLNHLLGKQLEHVLEEMGYSVKAREQNPRKQGVDHSEYAGPCGSNTLADLSLPSFL